MAGVFMEPRQLRCCVALAESLSFTRAADRAHVTQSTLSHQIRQLEDEAGQPLLATRTLLEECFKASGAEPIVVAETPTVVPMLGLVLRTLIGSIVAINAAPAQSFAVIAIEYVHVPYGQQPVPLGFGIAVGSGANVPVVVNVAPQSRPFGSAGVSPVVQAAQTRQINANRIWFPYTQPRCQATDRIVPSTCPCSLGLGTSRRLSSKKSLARLQMEWSLQTIWPG